MKNKNSSVRRLKNDADLSLRFPKLEKDSLHLRVYSDAYFAGSVDLSSQLGFIILLADKHNRCQPIAWSSHKSKRVTRSITGAEKMALADAFDSAYLLKHDLQSMLGVSMPMAIFMDSLSVLEVLTKATMPREKRFAIDVEALKDCNKRGELKTTVFIRGNANPADALTKLESFEVLNEVIQKAAIIHTVNQWVDRSMGW
eukprot:Plantae.Rhodophyta-Palmaria_palmata.ctg9188.p1 GENE.Plantae.Rhodophyta-Palmaria_palmata.ctg9188~~Plantae.Rhodophyta-Palmaria_palmata.ctg9188.p1  ORF type:complete len:200 (+),score=23.27 Plantae.Rhodophyta-Palmaria_palmata.ctg9188:260-859(+)